MKFAYADPPYLDCAVKLYGDHPEAAVYDTIEGHAELVRRLCADFPDGWAYSCTSSSLQRLLPVFPKGIRVAAWVKPFAAFKVNVNPAYAWEPVIFMGGRKRKRSEPTVRDWLAESITMRRGFPGAKPRAFCMWMFDLLGAQPTDTFVDLFPGSGAVQAAWHDFSRQPNQLELTA